jgi:hypothetical protein
MGSRCSPVGLPEKRSGWGTWQHAENVSALGVAKTALLRAGKISGTV